jgi:hypothetical protein
MAAARFVERRSFMLGCPASFGTSMRPRQTFQNPYVKGSGRFVRNSQGVNRAIISEPFGSLPHLHMFLRTALFFFSHQGSEGDSNQQDGGASVVLTSPVPSP